MRNDTQSHVMPIPIWNRECSAWTALVLKMIIAFALCHPDCTRGDYPPTAAPFAATMYNTLPVVDVSLYPSPTCFLYPKAIPLKITSPVLLGSHSMTA